VFFVKCFNYSKLQLRLKPQAVWLQFEVWIWFTPSVFCMLWQQVSCKLWTLCHWMIWQSINHALQISANHVGIHPVRIAKGWDKKVKKYVEVQFPTEVTKCNGCVGFTDLVDVLFAEYHIDDCTECVKWYHLDLWLGLNVACINSWILYKRHYSQLAVSGKERLDLLGFTSQCLVVANKSSFSQRYERDKLQWLKYIWTVSGACLLIDQTRVAVETARKLSSATCVPSVVSNCESVPHFPKEMLHGLQNQVTNCRMQWWAGYRCFYVLYSAVHLLHHGCHVETFVMHSQCCPMATLINFNYTLVNCKMFYVVQHNTHNVRYSCFHVFMLLDIYYITVDMPSNPTHAKWQHWLILIVWASACAIKNLSIELLLILVL